MEASLGAYMTISSSRMEPSLGAYTTESSSRMESSLGAYMTVSSSRMEPSLGAYMTESPSRRERVTSRIEGGGVNSGLREWRMLTTEMSSGRSSSRSRVSLLGDGRRAGVPENRGAVR